MVYTAFNSAPPSLADHLTLGNLCRHAAKEAVFCSQETFDRIGLAAAAIATFTSNSTLKFICTTGFALFACCRTRNEIQKVKACAAQFHNSNALINQKCDQLAQEMSGVQRELNSFEPWLVKAKNPVVNGRLEEVKDELKRANENLKRIKQLQDEAIGRLVKQDKCLKETPRLLFSYVIPLIAASVFVPSNSNLGFRLAAHFGPMITYLYRNWCLSLSIPISRLPDEHELMNVSQNLEMSRSYLKTASTLKAWVDRDNVIKAAEDFLKRLGDRVAPYRKNLIKSAEVMNAQITEFINLRTQYASLREEGHKLMHHPLRNTEMVDAFKSKCEKLLDSVKLFLQQKVESKEFHLWPKMLLQSFNLEAEMRLHCLNEVERRFSNHNLLPIVRPLFKRQRNVIAARASTVVNCLRGQSKIREKLFGMIEELNQTMAKLVDEKMLTLRKITGK